MMRELAAVLLLVLAALLLADYITSAPPAASPSAASSSPGAPPPGQPVSSARQAAHESGPGDGRRQWVTAWAASPQAAHAGVAGAGGFRDQTVREVVFTSAGGSALRLVLTNAYGTTALRAGGVTVGVAGAGAAMAAGSVRRVTFRGSAAVTIPAGGQAVSDPVAMAVPALRDLAVSIYLPGRAASPTMHLDAQQHAWISAAGDHAADARAAAFRVASKSWFYLSGVIVSGSRASGTVVAFGDSITDGLRSTLDANARWPDDLARRLGALPGPTLSVANAGISGDHLLAGTPDYPGALARFDADVLDQPGVREVIVTIGINDIRSGKGVSPRQMIAGYMQLIQRAHARGLKIFGGTLLPFRGTDHYTAALEATRQAVNGWIRASGAFDGVIDFAAIMAGPASPLSMRPAYDSGDHLHPRDAGYRAMAAAVSLPVLLAG